MTSAGKAKSLTAVSASIASIAAPPPRRPSDTRRARSRSLRGAGFAGEEQPAVDRRGERGAIVGPAGHGVGIGAARERIGAPEVQSRGAMRRAKSAPRVRQFARGEIEEGGLAVGFKLGRQRAAEIALRSSAGRADETDRPRSPRGRRQSARPGRTLPRHQAQEQLIVQPQRNPAAAVFSGSAGKKTTVAPRSRARQRDDGRAALMAPRVVSTRN